jgi:hypothetical protein
MIKIKMMKKVYLLLLTLPFILWACPKKDNNPPAPVKPPKPVACFTVNKTLFDSGETVAFTNCSTNSGAWLWNFGDGSTLATAKEPTHVYGPNRATYHVVLKALSADQSQQDDTAFNIVQGFRRIDSVVVVSVPNFNLGTDAIFQMGPSQNVSQYSAPHKVVSAFPTTFVFAGGVKITSANNNSWAGHIFDANTSKSIYPWGGAKNVFFSRGLNNSPVTFDDGFGFKMMVYYSLIPS